MGPRGHRLHRIRLVRSAGGVGVCRVAPRQVQGFFPNTNPVETPPCCPAPWGDAPPRRTQPLGGADDAGPDGFGAFAGPDRLVANHRPLLGGGMAPREPRMAG